MNRSKRRALLLAEIAGLALLAPSPALRFGGGIVTAYGLCTAAAALLAVIVFERLRIRALHLPKNDGPIAVLFRVDALELMLWCIPSALLGARALYVLLRPGYYLFDAGPLSALRLWEGGFLLWGAVLGAMAAACLLARKKKADALALLDGMAVPGLCMIALCRLAERFAGEGLGAWIENPAFARFPFVVMNDYGEWQLAVFLFEAAYALLMTVPVLRARAGKGERIAAALVLYSCGQIVFESLRMDSCLRIGFVRVSQVIAALAVLAVTAWRFAKSGGRRAALKGCILPLACIALIGGVEWALDKTQVSNILLYAVMAALCALMAVNALKNLWKEEKR